MRVIYTIHQSLELVTSAVTLGMISVYAEVVPNPVAEYARRDSPSETTEALVLPRHALSGSVASPVRLQNLFEDGAVHEPLSGLRPCIRAGWAASARGSSDSSSEDPSVAAAALKPPLEGPPTRSTSGEIEGWRPIHRARASTPTLRAHEGGAQESSAH